MPSTPEYTFRKEYADLGFEIIRLEDLLARDGDIPEKTPHRLTFYAMIFPVEGEGLHMVDFKEYRYTSGTIVLIGNGQIHAWVKQRELKGYILLFTQDFLYQSQEVFRDLSYSYPYNSLLYSPLLRINDPVHFRVLKSLVEVIYEEYSPLNGAVGQEIIQCLLRAVFLKLRLLPKQDITAHDKEHIALFTRFQQSLDQNLSATRNAQDYCQLLGVSYRKLNDVCKTLTQKTVKAFIDDVIVLKAKKYLADEDKNVSVVAYLLGFEDVSNFSKFFKKYTSQSPKQFVTALKTK